MPLLTLPSGAVAPLETPGLVPLLAGGGGTLAIARATLAHDEVDVEALGDEDLFFVALWGVQAFVASDAAITLAAVCEAFAEPPARRLHICDRTLAWVLDSGCLAALREARRELQAQDDPQQTRAGVLTYSVPDTWTGDDDD